MSKKITIEDICISVDEFIQLEKVSSRADMAAQLKISKDTILRLCKELDIKPSRTLKPFNPIFTKAQIMEARDKESHKTLGITSHLYRKHIKHYKIPNKSTRYFKKITYSSIGITRDDFIDMHSYMDSNEIRAKLDLKIETYRNMAKEAGVFLPRLHSLDTHYNLSELEFTQIYKSMSYVEILEEYNMSEDMARSFAKKLNINVSKHKTQDAIAEYIRGITKESVYENRRDILENNKEIDIKCGRLCIEYDGTYPHSIGNQSGMSWYDKDITPHENAKRQRYKTEFINNNTDYILFTIREVEWANKRTRDIWKGMINTKLNNNTVIYARKCEIRSIDVKDAKTFLEDNHMQGYIGAKLRFGLYYNNILVMVSTFSERKIFNNGFELMRMASAIGVTVVGGASRLIKNFERLVKPDVLISYADMRWSQGGVYRKMGFKYISTTQDFSYYRDGEIYSRYKFMKKNMIKMDNFNFDESLTGWENMKINGYRMIHGAGQMKFMKVYEGL